MKRQKSVGVDAHIDPKNKFDEKSLRYEKSLQYEKILQQDGNRHNRADVGIRPYSAGITLIALIVTIIVLLILAGISLNLINGGDGIIIQARWSEFVAEYTKLDEQKELYVAGKQMDKLSEEFSKANWRSLFTNISYAAEVPETMYPVDLNQPFSIWDTADTLKATICYVEKMQYSDLFNKDKVNLYRVDMSLLPNVEVRRQYVINIVSGMLYYIDGEPYKGLIYHTLKYGVPKDPEFPTPEPSEDDLTIHYLSGFDDQEETQTVPVSQSNSATLKPNPFARSGYNFQYWKEIQLDASGNPQMGTYTGIVHPDNATGVCMNGHDLWLEANWTNDPMNEITLDANGGVFDEDDVKDKLFSYQMPDTEHVKFNKKEDDTFGSELLIKPIYTAPDGTTYQFEGWFTEKTGGTIKVVGNVYHQSELSNDTLYAHWKKVTPTPADKDLTIHYLSRDAELDYSEPSYTQTLPAAQTASATLDACRFTGPTGYTFFGWGKVFQTDASAPYQHGDYYDVVNLLIRIFDEDWETDILDIIESYEDWESDAGDEDDGEDVTDDEPEPTMEEERQAEILDYFSGEETNIQKLFTDSTMTLNGLADFMVANQSYLSTLNAYENAAGMSATSTVTVVDYYDCQSGVDMNGQDLWLEAIWTNEYVITLDANGGLFDDVTDRIQVTIEAGDDYDSVIDEPEREGFTLEGWSTVPTGGTLFDTSTIFDPNNPASSPRMLYAQWVKDDETDKIAEIIFDGNGGTMLDDDGNDVAVITKNKVIGSLFGTMPTPDRLGYIFKGWFTTPTGGTEVKSGDTVTGPMKLYAQWTIGKDVKLDVQGGEIYRSGYWKAKGLYMKWEPGKEWNETTEKNIQPPYSGITMEEGMPIGEQAGGPYRWWGARGWKLPTGKCKYWCTAGGTAYRGVRKKMYGTKLNGNPYPKQVKFLGWYSKPNGQGNLVGPRDIWHDSVLDNVNDRVLYAAWDEALTITYEANGGYFGKPSRNVTKKQFYNKWEGKKYPKVARPKRDGYRFLGWYDAPIGGNKIELGKRTCLIQKSKTTVYAQWEKMDFTVNVFDVKENGWSQSITPVNGDFSTCTIKYKWSAKPKGTKGAKVHTTRNTSVTGRQPGKTFYVWAVAISKNREKFFSNVATVTLQYAPLAFNVNISSSSVGKNGWTQNCSATIGSLSGYKVAYVIEEVNASTGVTNSTATVNSDAPTNTISVSGKKEGNQGVKYKVWARATKGTNVVRSTNYVMVQTSHPTHYGDISTGGDCYKNYNICNNNTYYYNAGGSNSYPSSWDYITFSGTRYCAICATILSGSGYRAQKNGKNVKQLGVEAWCSVCGGKALVNSGSANGVLVCATHAAGWTYGSTSYTMNGISVTRTNCLYIGPITWGNTIYKSVDRSSATVSHNRIYNLTCSGLVNGSATSRNF